MSNQVNLSDWLKDLRKEDAQLTFDFDDNMLTTGYGAQPALTISSVGDDTITLGSGAVGASYDFTYNDTISITGIGANGPSGPSYSSGTFTYPQSNITMSSNTYAIGGGGSAGQILTTGTNGLTWADYSNVSPGLKVNGDAEFDGDLKIKGKSLVEMIENIEKRLAILHPNEKLEEKWEELKALGERYRELEKDIIEKEKMWDILKR